MKNIIRKEILKQRDQLSGKQLDSLSEKITGMLLGSSFYASAGSILTYLSFKSEVGTDKLIIHSLSKGKRVFVPVCVPETKELVISEIHSLDDLEQGFYNIRQPKKNRLFIADRSILDLVIVPAAAFDLKGNRIGYGAGYYDRFFKSAPGKICKVALAFSLQLLDFIPAQPHDVTMDYIITEKGIQVCHS